jgi:hypothetical protein
MNDGVFDRSGLFGNARIVDGIFASVERGNLWIQAAEVDIKIFENQKDDCRIYTYIHLQLLLPTTCSV